MSGPIAMATSKITGLGTPTVTTDATTKAYVDDLVNTTDLTRKIYIDAADGVNTSHADDADALRVLRTMRLESPSMHWKDLSVTSYTTNTDINLEIEVDALDGGDPGVSFTPILNGSEHGLLTIGKQGGTPQARQGNLTVSGASYY